MLLSGGDATLVRFSVLYVSFYMLFSSSLEHTHFIGILSLLMARKKHEPKGVTNPFNDLKPETIRGVFAVIFFVFALFFILSAFELAGVVGRYAKSGVTFLFGIGYYLVPILLIMLALSMFKEYEERKIGFVKALSSGTFLIAGLALIELIAEGRGGIIGNLLASPMLALFDMWASLIVLIGLVVVSILVLFDTHLRFSFPAPSFNMFKRKHGDEPDAPVADAEEEIEDDEEPEEEDPVEGEEAPEEIPEETERAKTTDRLKDMLGLGNKREIPSILEAYTPPPLSILERDKGKPAVGDTKANANLIKRTLQNFGIRVEIDEINVGPTVTRYALKPAEGVRMSKFTSLQDNIQAALAATSIRIEAPIPGKSLVGVEVPNKTTSTISLYSLLSSPDFSQSAKPLLVALGRDITGNPIYADIAKMPHGLIAGTTGSGKSVTIHAIILSLLYRNSPHNLRFIMIDPKRVELTQYNKIPHLQTPVITKAKDAILALKWAVGEMERRLNVLETEGVRDISSYHANVLSPALKEFERKKRKLEAAGEEPDDNDYSSLPETMPYMVIVIDELADLMSAYPRELEAGIVRLAQMSRAAGIHLLLATQSPRVNVITGLIKANIPTRLALAVNSQIDSRTILDSGGAEKLLGKGDMLYQSGESTKPIRIQSPYTSEAEVKKVVAFLAKQDLSMLSTGIDLAEVESSTGHGIFAGALGGDGDGEDDSKLAEAKQVVIETGKASTSFLQRKLGVGYSRAAKLIDLLEERGIIGPQNGSKPREVLLSSGEDISDEGEYSDSGYHEEDIDEDDERDDRRT